MPLSCEHPIGDPAAVAPTYCGAAYDYDILIPGSDILAPGGITRQTRWRIGIEDGGGDDDESKTRKHTPFSARISNLVYPRSPSSTHGRCLAASSLLLTRHSFPVVAPLDSLASDFGSLGVPWCRSKDGKMAEWTAFDHSFVLWFMARWIKPGLMIESGAVKGHSTWVLRQARPEMSIVLISSRHPQKYLVKEATYVDQNCTYFAGKDFVDFRSVGWGVF